MLGLHNICLDVPEADLSERSGGKWVILQMITENTMWEWESETEERKPIYSVLMTGLPLWTTEAQSNQGHSRIV